MIEKYYFLFGLALIWVIAATVQDIRKTEVSNWLSFSLIWFALAYRAFYSSFADDWSFFYFGLLGFGVFFLAANGFYYARVFAGGDAKLLMGLGAVLPFESFGGLFFESAGFLFVLFSTGWIYSMIYSIFLVKGNFRKFKKEFGKEFENSRITTYIMLLLGIVFWVLVDNILGIAIFVFFIFIFIYARTLEKCCMIQLVKADDLMEGDWLEKDVNVGRRVIKKSVHGVSLEEIKILRNAKKKVLIMKGIPFVPAFLISWMIMVFFYLVLELSFLKVFSLL